ncbi:MAG: hypothetical protein NT141_01085 [candidate division WWE3 bacterium]|nr:hypothetical protein [candidate division WWE3 bacterium]
MKISWLLHLHQPSFQDPEVVASISNSSYRPLLAILQRHPAFHVTLDISGTLIKWWSDSPEYADILNSLRELIGRGQVEVTGGGWCHPVLPLLPEAEIKRQIELQEDCLRHNGLCHVSPKGRLRGFFPPELAINDTVICILNEKKYDWVLVDEVAALGKSHFLSLPSTATKVIVRDRGASLAVAFGYAQNIAGFKNLIDAYGRFSDQLVLALDGETFGHHWTEGVNFLEAVAALNYEYLTISELASVVDFTATTAIAECSWGTTDAGLKAGVLYPHWQREGNAIHALQWELIGLAINVVEKSELIRNGIRINPNLEIDKNRSLLDRALNSDQFWWASRDPYWSPDMVQRGAELLLSVVGSTNDGIAKVKAQDIYNKIVNLLDSGSSPE